MARREIKSEGKDVATAIIRGLNELGRRRDQVEVTVLQEEKAGFLGIGGKPAIVHIIEKKWDAEHSAPIKPRAAKETRERKDSRYQKGARGPRGPRKDSRDSRRGGSRKYAAFGREERPSNLPKVPKENEPQKLPAEYIQNAVIPENIKEPMAQAKECLLNVLKHMDIKVENLNAWWDNKHQRILLTFDCDHPAVVIGKEGKTLESIQYLITLVISRHFDTPISVVADTQNYWRKIEDKIDAEINRAV
ncbi:MAG: Jag N-terminal domain-containing protein, partial [Elusimicrobiota bacterium]|nr:Jag N-terminal domain-containing protein [Elusimicrobiota bacterium]